VSVAIHPGREILAEATDGSMKKPGGVRVHAASERAQLILRTGIPIVYEPEQR